MQNSSIPTVPQQQQALSGEIPAALGNLTVAGSFEMYLNNNNLSGPIPEELGDLRCKIIQQLYLNNNALSGEIPAALGGLTVLHRDAPPQQQSERAPPGGVRGT